MRQPFRSELIRIWRPSFLFGGIGVMAGFAALVSIFIFTSATNTPVSGPPALEQGRGAYTVAQIASPDGFLTPLGTVSSLAGVILLALWAIAMATDYSTGLIRILVQAEPKRIKLMWGKILALAVFTLLAATITTARRHHRPTTCPAPGNPGPGMEERLPFPSA
jgi:ABC-2 type transport system permease protein